MTQAPETKHCDDYIDDKAQPKALRRFLRYHRWPAVWQVRAESMGVIQPVLFATLKCHTDKERQFCKNYSVPDGSRVRVVMASRMGDVGISIHHQFDRGYQVRIDIDRLVDFSETP